MSEFHVQVVRLGAVEKHPNADTLSTTQVHGGYPVIFRTGDYQPGDLAVYVPIDAVVPDRPEWAFLDGHRRIRAKRLRGVFSMGLLAKASEGAAEGDDVREVMGIEKWEPDVEMADGDEPGPACVPVYDLEGLRKFRTCLVAGETVVITEKIHGENARLFHDGERLWVGSRVKWKKPGSPNGWRNYADRNGVEARLAAFPHLCFFGELYGNTELRYGASPTDRAFRVFDVIDTRTRCFLDHDAMAEAAARAGFQTVPVLYVGPWLESLTRLAEGVSTLGQHVREGFVVRPLRERHDPLVGRVVLKMHGEGFLTRKESR